MPLRTLHLNNCGFTLVEVLVAILILLVGLLGLLETVNVGISHNMRNQLRDQAVLISEMKMSQFRTRPFDQLTSAFTSKSTFEDYSSQRIRGVKMHYQVEYALTSVDGLPLKPLNTSNAKILKVNVSWTHKEQSYQTGLVTFKGN